MPPKLHIPLQYAALAFLELTVELKDEQIQVLSCSAPYPTLLGGLFSIKVNKVKTGSLQEPGYDNFFNFGVVDCACQCSSHLRLSNSNAFSLPFDEPSSSLEGRFWPPYT